jgi:hypothetical protein
MTRCPACTPDTANGFDDLCVTHLMEYRGDASPHLLRVVSQALQDQLQAISETSGSRLALASTRALYARMERQGEHPEVAEAFHIETGYVL